MGVPSRARQHNAAAAAPRLRVVSQRTARESRIVSARAARDAFVLCTIVLVAVCTFGMGRVALAQRAFDDALSARHLEEAIKDERLLGDMLEVDKSALATPSRIENIAGATMQMAEADDVCYMEMPVGAEACSEDVGEAAVATGDDSSNGLDLIVSAVRGLATTEVQSLLLGDVGLASRK